MKDPQPYIVRQGDHLRQLAHEGGFNAAEVWHDPLNAELRELRGTGDDLFPGDLLWIPATPEYTLALIPASENDYNANVPRVTLDLFFEDMDGPIATEPCQVLGLPGTGEDGIAKTSTADGSLKLYVPVTVPEITVSFPKRHRSFRVRIGHMDPANEQSGIVKRLANLGYLDPESPLHDGDVAAALAYFQQNAGLDVTGQLDELTRARLVQEAEVPPVYPED